MPRHLISDAHEWINEIPSVPIYYLANPQPRERSWHNQRGKKTLLSLTLVRLCEVARCGVGYVGEQSLVKYHDHRGGFTYSIRLGLNVVEF